MRAGTRKHDAGTAARWKRSEYPSGSEFRDCDIQAFLSFLTYVIRAPNDDTIHAAFTGRRHGDRSAMGAASRCGGPATSEWSRSAERLGQGDDDAGGAAQIAEAVDVLVLHHLSHQLG